VPSSKPRPHKLRLLTPFKANHQPISFYRRLSRLLTFLLFLSFLTLAFYVGSKLDLQRQIPQLVSQLPPSPTPDSRAVLNQTVPVDNLKLIISQATRIIRPAQASDLGVFTLKFSAVSPCGEIGTNDPRCTFQSSAFSLINDQSRELLPQSSPPNQFIRDLVPRPLSASRSLYPLITETGQVYFLLPKDSNDFTLTYTSPATNLPIRFHLTPSTYPYQEAGEPICPEF
jgi:hypothetical protein